jgi:hypothetical protein
MSSSVARHWKDSLDTRRLLFDRFKNSVELGQAEVRSIACINEMRKLIVADSDNIQAQDNYSDNRPYAAALAIYAWSKWLQKRYTLDHWTFARAQKVEQLGGENPMDGILQRFLDQRKITVRDRA